MSLILEALKKLDREKKVPDRGFLVVGAVPWPAPRPRRWLPALFVLAVGAAAGSALWLAWRARAREEAPVRIATPSTAPAPVAAPPVAAPPATVPPAAESGARVPEMRLPAERPAPARIDRPAPTATTAAGPRPAATAPPAAAAPSEPGARLVLEAISERDGKPIAVLNSRVVHEGDHFDGVTVVRIGVDEVEIEVQGRRRTLRF